MHPYPAVPVPNSDTPTQTKKAIPIPTMPDLLKATADPNTAPGEGPLNTLAKEERYSEGNLNAPPNEVRACRTSGGCSAVDALQVSWWACCCAVAVCSTATLADERSSTSGSRLRRCASVCLLTRTVYRATST